MAGNTTAKAGVKLMKSAARATAKKVSKSPAAQDAPKKAAATKASAKKASATKSEPAKKSAPAKKVAPVKKTTGAKKSAAKKAAPVKSAPKSAPKGKAAPAQLVVREDESPWTAKELKEVKAELDAEIQRLTAEIAAAEADLNEFLKEPIDGAGDDQADAGAKSFEREHELNLVAGARTGLEQNQHALARLEDGTYGICESCGNPIGKLRLQAYPRATLCMTCKSRQERR